jgi:cytoskeletal protein CcmA (bactofilin family)
MRILCRILFFFLLFAIVLQRAPQALAFEVRSADSVILPHDQVLTSSVLMAGKSVSIDGIVHGDVYCVGQNVVVSGLVDGDVLCAGQSIRLSGVVTGNVRILGQTIDLSGTVQRNASIVGQTTTVAQDGSVNGELLFAGQTMAVNGLVGKSASGVGQTVMLNGTVLGDVWYTGQSVMVGDNAVVRGNFRYTSQTETAIPKTASISGAVTYTQMKAEKENRQRRASIVSAANPVMRFGRLFMGIIWNLAVAALLVYFLPKSVAKVKELMKRKPVKVGLVGLLALVVLPIGGILLLITLIGIPFAIIWFILYGIAIGISKIFPALLAGEYLIKRLYPRKKESRWWPVAVGIPVSWILFSIPVIGWLLSFAAVCWGFGGMTRAALASRKK